MARQRKKKHIVKESDFKNETQVIETYVIEALDLESKPLSPRKYFKIESNVQLKLPVNPRYATDYVSMDVAYSVLEKNYLRGKIVKIIETTNWKIENLEKEQDEALKQNRFNLIDMDENVGPIIDTIILPLQKNIEETYEKECEDDDDEPVW